MTTLFALLAGCPTPETDKADDTGTSDDTGTPAPDPARYEPACGPDDGVTRMFFVGTASCDENPAMPYARMMTDATTFAAGDRFTIADGSLLAWWQTDETAWGDATEGVLEVTAVDGDTVSFTWSLVVDGETHGGAAEAAFCPTDTLICG